MPTAPRPSDAGTSESKGSTAPKIVVEEVVISGLKNAAISATIAAAIMIPARRQIPWAKVNLNRVAQSLIVSTAGTCTFFIYKDKTFLKKAKVLTLHLLTPRMWNKLWRMLILCPLMRLTELHILKWHVGFDIQTEVVWHLYKIFGQSSGWEKGSEFHYYSNKKRLIQNLELSNGVINISC